jgi:hypothetical protein
MGRNGQAYNNPQGRAAVLEQLIAQRLFLLDAQRNLYEREQAFKDQLAAVKEQLLMEYAISKCVESVRVTEEDVRGYYDSHKDEMMDEETVNAILETEVFPIIELIFKAPFILEQIVFEKIGPILDEEIKNFLINSDAIIEMLMDNLEGTIDLIFNELKASGLEFLHKLDLAVFLLERFAYMQVTTFQGMLELDYEVKEINPLATMMYVGLYNPLSGVSIDIDGTIVPIGKIFDAYYNWSFLDMAYLVDTASPKEIAQITKGDIYDYAESSARDSWPTVSAYKDGDVLPRTYATDIRPVLFSQLRNGGYRLAAIFNEIFK